MAARPIVDAHVHIWDTTTFPIPWLEDIPALEPTNLDRRLLRRDRRSECRGVRLSAGRSCASVCTDRGANNCIAGRSRSARAGNRSLGAAGGRGKGPRIFLEQLGGDLAEDQEHPANRAGRARSGVLPASRVRARKPNPGRVWLDFRDLLLLRPIVRQRGDGQTVP